MHTPQWQRKGDGGEGKQAEEHTAFSLLSFAVTVINILAFENINWRTLPMSTGSEKEEPDLLHMGT
jgi:hypothetical protein